MDPKVKQEASWLSDRLKEPSTYAGLAAIAMVFHVGIPTDLMTSITSLGVGVGGVLAFVLGESK